MDTYPNEVELQAIKLPGLKLFEQSEPAISDREVVVGTQPLRKISWTTLKRRKGREMMMQRR